jgi:5-methylcytosine-specific restriction endonuclease McrA
MKLELFIVLIVSIFTANIYYDGKILSMIKSYSKYYKMGVIAFVGLCVYIYIKRSPQNRRQFFENANGYIKYLPIDRETTSVLAPIIDFTGKALSDSVNSNYVPRNQNQNQNQNNFSNLTGQQKKILNNSRTTKRSVSETKKKYVASSQDWKCKHCNIKLPAWFEVDHVKKLEYGGSNDIDNLEALCRDCHGKKTALENL